MNMRAAMPGEHQWFVPFIGLWTRKKLPWVDMPATYGHAREPEESGFMGLLVEYAATVATPG